MGFFPIRHYSQISLSKRKCPVLKPSFVFKEERKRIFDSGVNRIGAKMVDALYVIVIFILLLTK